MTSQHGEDDVLSRVVHVGKTNPNVEVQTQASVVLPYFARAVARPSVEVVERDRFVRLDDQAAKRSSLLLRGCNKPGHSTRFSISRSLQD